MRLSKCSAGFLTRVRHALRADNELRACAEEFGSRAIEWVNLIDEPLALRGGLHKVLPTMHWGFRTQGFLNQAAQEFAMFRLHHCMF